MNYYYTVQNFFIDAIFPDYSSSKSKFLTVAIATASGQHCPSSVSSYTNFCDSCSSHLPVMAMKIIAKVAMVKVDIYGCINKIMPISFITS